ncbi:hypothetical protein BU23DRAFT_635531 [Bimuria novae-zelandiae CBS 107.79]|uniref:Uncharacterized protein n=1 Tax=Bimuria novae-zelandiae CBS 107.79 TaxID=1447943 RepID=A0A6A5VI48_9PLEO|nr:hypothetical protein BU23DRAFT_635531 [Bimuria novae-zelandiae CBS 107.79]
MLHASFIVEIVWLPTVQLVDSLESFVPSLPIICAYQSTTPTRPRLGLASLKVRLFVSACKKSPLSTSSETAPAGELSQSRTRFPQEEYLPSVFPLYASPMAAAGASGGAESPDAAWCCFRGDTGCTCDASHEFSPSKKIENLNATCPTVFRLQPAFSCYRWIYRSFSAEACSMTLMGQIHDLRPIASRPIPRHDGRQSPWHPSWVRHKTLRKAGGGNYHSHRRAPSTDIWFLGTLLICSACARGCTCTALASDETVTGSKQVIGTEVAVSDAPLGTPVIVFIALLNP